MFMRSPDPGAEAIRLPARVAGVDNRAAHQRQTIAPDLPRNEA
jgi:hypothetical protein